MIAFSSLGSNDREAQGMKHILETYEVASGQAISLPKP